ncbi:unnamed protein product [Blepharisma stoltei]|uniref:Uncharacterized protein n=1 Tax=Blepharisma stoltei TaxID=1481888 RepID=A0AAU9I8R8_9CILI|nr:unnamed protein product [Blepharisma stoltei]
MKASYRVNQKYISLTQADEEVKTAYSNYVSIYNEYYGKLRAMIADLISKSFSPYPYDDSKFVYSVNHIK